MKEVGTFSNLRIELPVSFVVVTDITMWEEFNEHGRAKITGWLEEGEEKTVLDQLTMDCNVNIVLAGEKESKTLFSGVPTKVELRHAGNSYELYLELYTHSIGLDIKPKRKSWQDRKNTYENMFRELVAEYGGSIQDVVSKGAVQTGAYIQYDETDWEFLKRMASYIGAKVYPLVSMTSPQIIVGLEKKKHHKLDSSVYGLYKDVVEFQSDKESVGGVVERFYQTYEVKTTESYDLGDVINYREKEFVVIKKFAKIAQGELKYTYHIRKEQGIKQKKRYNQRLVGALISGTILAREKDKLKLHLEIDKTQEEAKAHWYQVSTMYTGGNSTGWYAMPEVGESVSLLLPEQDETKAYITRVNRRDEGENPKTGDPATKYFGTAQGKELKLSPSDITLHAVEGETYLRLSDTGGVEVKTPHAISIQAGKNVEGNCETFSATSKDKIILATKATTIVVDNVMHIRG